MTPPGLFRRWRLAAALAAAATAAAVLHGTGVGRGGPAAGAADSELAAEVGRRYGGMKRLLFPGQPEMSVAEWLDRPKDQPAVLVDVREPHERRVSMLPGAITQQDFERNSARYRSWVVVPYCTIGLRSGIYTRELRGQGFEVRNLAGSALAWAHAGLPFESKGKATRRVHVFNADWNLLPRGYEPVVSKAQPNVP
ncbi:MULTISPECIES: rhodanese-like domain-containing protein [unclassified Cyanobium]|uniref:rhodanese-like domain-containing protein n=1 Tax=unclassified Cyanobium TaxID=2627006 RepID=UPI0020CC4D6C|nr:MULTISPECIES: rhodanese-like domain-containing protein [unclassified Cyanobium]MCP9835471.1 MPT-synthase sulfurylase [Cyanobium sp. La Preciosa 7G6]MCP9938237.1 MPT-synthase sulfurylase [Cyanobium sp. Aljojuca 7A6]